MKLVRLAFVSKTFLTSVLNEPLLRDCTIMESIINYFLDPESINDGNELIGNKRERIPMSIINKPDVS